MSETIEERGQYCLEQVSAGIAIIEERLTANGGVLFKLDLLVKLKGLLDDLMAERGKKKERIEKAQGELIELSEALDAWGYPATAGQLMGIYDILEDK